MSTHSPSITLSARLEINAIIDGLMVEGEFFLRAPTKRLVQLVPFTRKPSLFQVSARWSSSSSVAGGATPSGQQVSLESGAESRSFTVGRDGSFKIGGWSVWHELGKIDISMMWNDDMGPSSICRLVYDKKTQDPIELQLSRERSIWIGFAHLYLTPRFERWKAPAHAL